MGKARDDLYQRLHGFKTINRGYKREGQSEWYYVDPRYDKDDDPRGQIDVANENSPNPRLNDILADDMQKNPEDYYIWRTVGDDKVRSAHAEREGEFLTGIFRLRAGIRVKITIVGAGRSHINRKDIRISR